IGAYSPLPSLPAATDKTISATAAQPVVAAMARRGTPATGLIYCGLPLTAKGPRVVALHVGFGEPAAQSVLARVNSPMGQTLLAAAEGRLNEVGDLDWDPRA